jgi:hypothetical protein
MSPRLASALLLLAVTAPLTACTEDSGPLYLASTQCSLPSCLADLDDPVDVAVGGELALYVGAEPDTLFSVRSTDPTVLTAELAGYDLDVHALRPGVVAIQLVDERGDVADRLDLTVAAPDHLEADLRWVENGAQVEVDHVRAEDPQLVASDAAVGMKVRAFAGARQLSGLIAYEIEASLPEGAHVDTSGVGEAIVYLASGEHSITYRTGELSERFVITTR